MNLGVRSTGASLPSEHTNFVHTKIWCQPISPYNGFDLIFRPPFGGQNQPASQKANLSGKCLPRTPRHTFRLCDFDQGKLVPGREPFAVGKLCRMRRAAVTYLSLFTQIFTYASH